MRTIGRKLRNEAGATAVEYALVLAVIVVMVVGTASAFTPKLQEMWTKFGDQLVSLAGGGAGKAGKIE